MRPLLVSGLVLTSVVATVVFANAQHNLQAPLEPVAPTDVRECAALANAWGQVCRQVDRLHTQCLDNYAKKKVPQGKTCSKAPCQRLHGSCGPFGDRNRTEVDRCYAKVREHDRLERERRRQQRENFRRSRDVIRQRGGQLQEHERRRNESETNSIDRTTDRLRRQRDGFTKESSRHRDKAKEFERLSKEYLRRYSSDSTAPGPRPGDDLATLESLVESKNTIEVGGATKLAERRFIDVDGGDFLERVGTVLRKDVIPALDLGLGGRHAHEPIRIYRQAKGMQARYERFTRFVDFARERFSEGALDLESRLDFITDTVKELGSVGLKNTPAAYMFGRAVDATRETLSSGLAQFETSIRLFHEGATTAEFDRATDPREILENLFRSVVPYYDTARRIETGVDTFKQIIGWE